MHDTLIDPATLASRLGDPGWVVLDARHDLAHPVDWGRGEYRKGHVPGAVGSAKGKAIGGCRWPCGF
jgi:3-mercaptopyruvate sulfurtransferase SseA